MTRSRSVRRVLTLVVAMAAVIGQVVTAAGTDDDLPAVRRILLRPEQLPAELERVRNGALRQLALADFDALIARAATAEAALRDPPRLVESRYRAVLAGESLSGSAAWTVLHRRATPGLLSLDPLTMAVRSAMWDDGTPALLGDLDRRPQAPGLELFVGRSGEQRVTVNWSARGVAEPAGLRFDLRVPACPVAVLEIDVPADREPVAAHEVGLLTGPFAAPAADRRLWRLAFAGSSQVPLTFRPAANPSPLILASQSTQQEVSPGETACEFTFDLELPRGGTRDLTVACAPVLRPTEVIVRSLDRWEVKPGTAENEWTRVLIRLREPLQSGKVTLRAVAQSRLDRRWTSPAASVLGAISRGEALAIRVHPDLRLDDWRAGPFRLIESVVTPDRWQVLTLQSGMILNDSHRPTAWVRPAGPDFQVRERLWWQVGAGRMTLTAQLAVEVAHGSVFQIPLRLPVGWEVERIEAAPSELIAAAPLTPAPGQPLVVNLQRAIGPGTTARLIVRLGRRRPAELISFPDLLPIGARSREGVLAIRIEPGLESAVTDIDLSAPKLPADGEPAPWGPAAADYLCPLRSTTSEGTLQIWQQPAQVRANSLTTVTVIGRQAAVACRLRLEPVAGGADAVVVYVPNSADPWDWQVLQGGNRVRSIQRLGVPPPRMLALLAARSPWDGLVAAELPAEAPGTHWLVAFARPLTEPVDLEAHVMLPIPDPKERMGGPWAVPLIRVPTSVAEVHRASVDLRSTRGWHPESQGMTDVPAANRSPRFRAFEYGAGPATLALIPGDRGAMPVLDRVRLVTYATDPSRFVHRLSFRLWDWDRPTLPLDLPTDSIIEQVRINGVVAFPSFPTPGAPAVHVEVPIPGAAQSLAIEVVYSTPCLASGMIAHLSSSAPLLPVASATLRRIWCLPPGVTPLWPQEWGTVTKSDATALFWKQRAITDDRGSDDLDERGTDKPRIGDSRLSAEVDGTLPAGIDRGTFWEPSADPAARGDSIRVVRARDVSLIGGVMALAGASLAWGGRAWPASRYWAALLCWLGLWAAGVVWLPGPLAAAAQWPLLAGVLVACWRLLRVDARREPSTLAAPRQSAAAQALTAILVAAVWVSSGGRAAAPGPVTVYLVPGMADASASQAVLAPPDLLGRLQAVCCMGSAGLDTAAWLDARYDGRVAGPQARFTAVLRLHSFADDPSPLALPLTGVQIGDAKLDGNAAFLRAVGDRYLVPIHGRGSHTLEMSFTAPCPSIGDDREVRFGIPEIPISRLTLTAPATADHFRAVSRRGSEEIDDDAGRPRLNVDLGRVGAAHVRWRAIGPKPTVAVVQHQETYLWSLTESAARLYGAVQFDVASGSTTALALTVPQNLEVATVAARPVDGGVAAGWLRSWNVAPVPTDGRRQLILEFASPIAGRWHVNVECVPREPFAQTFTLPFPSAEGARFAPPVFAWRAQGVNVIDVPPDGASSLAPDAFLRDHWNSTKVEADPRPPNRAYTRATEGPIPALRFRADDGPGGQATTEIYCRIGPRRAEIEATARVAVRDGQVSLVEWDVPTTIDIASIRGSDVHTWSRTGSSVQVWLTKPVAEAAIQIMGSVDRSTIDGTFDVPPIRPRVADVSGHLQVSAREGILGKPVVTAHLTESAAHAGNVWSYMIDGPQPYRATFEVRAAGGGAAPPRSKENRPAPPPALRLTPVRVEFADDIPAGDDGPRLTWSSSRPEWPVRLLRTAAIVLVGLIGLWLGRRYGRTAWPEHLALLGCAAWAADSGLAWLLPTIVGISIRCGLLVKTAFRRSRPPADAALNSVD